MTTVLQYLVIGAVIGLLLFGVSLLLFGRGERLSALPARTSPAQLPERGIDGGDVRRVRFALALRGYRMSDVDWTLDRLADELDRTQVELIRLTGGADSAAEQPSHTKIDSESKTKTETEIDTQSDTDTGSATDIDRHVPSTAGDRSTDPAMNPFPDPAMATATVTDTATDTDTDTDADADADAGDRTAAGARLSWSPAPHHP
ncbi:MAG: DivIVA domain-containing protein, partial [Nakamurella sp.]